jgi:hypothetical protein
MKTAEEIVAKLMQRIAAIKKSMNSGYMSPPVRHRHDFLIEALTAIVDWIETDD